MADGSLTIVETCPCGARLEVGGGWSNDVKDQAREFREFHAGCINQAETLYGPWREVVES